MILCPKKDNSVDARVRISKTEFGFVVEADDNYRFEFDSRLVKTVPDMMFLNRDIFGNPAFTWLSETASCRDGYLSSRIRKRIFNDTSMCVAVIAIDQDHVPHIYAMEAASFNDDLEYIEVGYFMDQEGAAFGRSSSEVMGHHIPSLSAFVKHCREKQLVVGKISETDSLMALETQVDLLTKALATVIARTPGARPDWWDEFELAMMPHSSIPATPAGVTKMIGDAKDHKEKIRAIQAEYFAKVSEIYAG